MNKKVKKFKDFLKEEFEYDLEDVQVEEPEVQIEEPSSQIEEEPYDQIKDKYDEEEEDMLELIYDKDTDQFLVDSELDVPTDYNDFENWFMNIDEEETSVSMADDEEKNDIIYYMPVYLYIEYLDGVKDEYIEED